MPRNYIGGIIGVSPLVASTSVEILMVGGGGGGGPGEGRQGGARGPHSTSAATATRSN